MPTLERISGGAITTAINTPNLGDRNYVWMTQIFDSNNSAALADQAMGPNAAPFGVGGVTSRGTGNSLPNPNGPYYVTLYFPVASNQILRDFGVTTDSEAERLFTILRVARYRDGRQVTEEFTARLHRFSSFPEVAFVHLPRGDGNPYQNSAYPVGVPDWANQGNVRWSPAQTNGLTFLRDYVVRIDEVNLNVPTNFITDCVVLDGLSRGVGSGDSGSGFSRNLAMDSSGKIGVAPASADVNPGIEFMQFSSSSGGNRINIEVNYFGSGTATTITTRNLMAAFPDTALTNVLDQHYDVTIIGHVGGADNTTATTALDTLRFANDDFILTDNGDDIIIHSRRGSGSALSVQAPAGTDIATAPDDLIIGDGLVVTSDTGNAATASSATLSVAANLPRVFTSAFDANTVQGNNRQVTITHNLNNRYPLVSVYDNTHTMVLPMAINADSVNATTLVFPTRVTGNVTLIG